METTNQIRPARSQVRLSDVSRIGALVVACAGLGVSANESANDSELKKEIVKAWEGRQASVRTAVFEWTEDRFEAKGWKKWPGMLEKYNPKNVYEPATDITYQLQSRLVYSGKKTRYSYVNRSWKQAEGAPNDYVSVFDGTTGKVFFSRNFNREYPQGNVGKSESAPDIKSAHLKPFQWLYGLPDPNLSDFDFESLALSPLQPLVDGRKQIVFQQTYKDAPGSKIVVWIDPSQSYLISHLETVVEGRKKNQFDLEYRKQDDIWIPSKWKFSSFASDDGSTNISTRGTLLSAQFNQPIPSKEFVFEFPPGTYVFEKGGKSYVEREHGAKRIIAPEETGASYEDYLTTETGSVRPVGRDKNSSAWWYVSGAFLLMIFAWLYFWKSGHRQKLRLKT